jgi:hypothetical protein
MKRSYASAPTAKLIGGTYGVRGNRVQRPGPVRRVLLLAPMPGASERARRVKVLNANWTAGQDGEDGRFEILIVTEDDERHVVAPSAAAMSALVALARAETVLVWDPADRTLIAANVVGTMPWTEREQSPQG